MFVMWTGGNLDISDTHFFIFPVGTISIRILIIAGFIYLCTHDDINFCNIDWKIGWSLLMCLQVIIYICLVVFLKG